jgi:pSer/pThr/pTyr-binding forkhead associated (FHA) protein
VTLAQAAIVVGRDGDDPGTLRLPDPEVSRTHARFQPSRTGWEVVDCGSRNGVHVDGCRTDRAELAPERWSGSAPA